MLGLALTENIDAAQTILGKNNSLWLILIICALIGPLFTICKVLQWSASNWSNHPIAKALSVYCNNNSTWLSIASDVNIEFRR